MINSRKELLDVLKIEETKYFKSRYDKIKLMLLSDHDYLIWEFLVSLRYMEYHKNTNHKIRYYLWEKRKNLLGAKYGLTMWPNCIDKGLKIWHYGSVIVNGKAKIGKNCQLHGENCIGNKGDSSIKAPIIGDNVDIGVGAKVIGDVFIANNVKIGANAVVTKSCYEEGAILVGVPAKIKH